MDTKQFDLTQDERDLIVYSLNKIWVDTTNKLEEKNLGDLDRKYLEFTQYHSKKLLMKIAGELDFSD